MADEERKERKEKDFSPKKRAENVEQALRILANCEITPDSEAAWDYVKDQYLANLKRYQWKRGVSSAPTEETIPSNPPEPEDLFHKDNNDIEYTPKLKPGYKWSKELWNSKPDVVAMARHLRTNAASSGLPMTDREMAFVYGNKETNEKAKINDRGQCTLDQITMSQFALLEILDQKLRDHLHVLSLQTPDPPPSDQPLN